MTYEAGSNVRDLRQDLREEIEASPADIRDLCTGAAFDGKFFHLGCPEVFSIIVVEKAKGAAATGDAVKSFVEWLLCTWDLAHRIVSSPTTSVLIERV